MTTATAPARARRVQQPLYVRPIDDTALGAVSAVPAVTAVTASFLQTPEWAGAKPGWDAERLGWFDAAGDLAGAALVLHRPAPGGRHSLAYLPEGPVLPWRRVGADPAAWLGPMVAHLRRRHAFAVRIGPAVPVRSWTAASAKAGLADPGVQGFGDLRPDSADPDGAVVVAALRRLGWRPVDEGTGGFGSGQPRFGVRIDLRGRTVEDLLAGANQQWRRNVTRAARAGVRVRQGGAADLAVFHRLYTETAARDGFTPRPAGYFDGLWRALHPAGRAATAVARLYLADAPVAGGDPLAAALTIEVGGHCWYVYGASTARHRDVQASTALQWRAICDAQARGCHTYDLRGITGTLDPDDPASGLLRFKLATGGTVVETCGEWELPLNRPLYAAFRLAMRAR